jgi:UDP-N-acetylmuramoylalanine--D-glutamate ligase
VANFKGLPHRLELVKIIGGVKYYDDSFATTPESTIIALKSFAEPIILLLGGADKGSNFKKLAEEVVNRVYPVKSPLKRGAKQFNGVKFVVLLKGDATPRIKKELVKAGFRKDSMRLAGNIGDAVKIAEAGAGKGDVILLSTACASFGMFKNYKERGDLFKQEVRRIK